MRAIFTFLAFAIAGLAHAQQLNWGITGRAGAIATTVSADKSIATSAYGTDVDYSYKPGLQVVLGAWATVPISQRGAVYLVLQPTLSRQHAGEIQVVDRNRNAVSDAEAVNFSFMTGISGLYQHNLSDRLAIGAGVGAYYLLRTNTQVHVAANTFTRGGEETKLTYSNHTYRRMPIYLPIEVQLKLSQRLWLVGQVQVGLSNRLAATETAFKERDLVLQLGINYSIK